ncbi:MAG: zinc ribbon domain-containing protein [Lentisphaeria bacterium]
MIICPKCHSENLLTAVFCRNCGEKLDLDKLKPEEIGDGSKKKGKSLATQLVYIFISLFILALIAGSFIPVSGKLTDTKLDKKTELTYKKFESSKRYKGGVDITFTEEEASSIVNDIFVNYKDEEIKLIPSNVTVRFTNDNYVKMILTSKFSFLKLTTTVKAAATTEPKTAGLHLTPVSARFGYIPIPVSLIPKLTKNFKEIAQKKLERAQANVKTVEITNKTIHLTK